MSELCTSCDGSGFGFVRFANGEAGRFVCRECSAWAPEPDANVITPRDLFAAAALAGFLSAGAYSKGQRKDVAEDAFGWADAMMAARGKR